MSGSFKLKGSLCYDTGCPNSFILPPELLKQIKLEALANAAIQTLRFQFGGIRTDARNTKVLIN
jgi:hypothetical protein